MARTHSSQQETVLTDGDGIGLLEHHVSPRCVTFGDVPPPTRKRKYAKAVLHILKWCVASTYSTLAGFVVLEDPSWSVPPFVPSQLYAVKVALIASLLECWKNCPKADHRTTWEVDCPS